MRSFKQEISSLNLPDSERKSFVSKGFHMVDDIYYNDGPISSKYLKELIRPPESKSALLHLEEEAAHKNFKICSYIDNLDTVLNGLLMNGLITEFVGLPDSGRTQMCLHLSVTAQVPKNGVFGEIAYICTNWNFSVSRLKEIADCCINKCGPLKNCTIDDILKRIHYIDIATMKELQECMKHLKGLLEEHCNVRMVILDSITYPLREVEKADKITVMYSLIQGLKHLANLYKFTIILTNDMTTVVDTSDNSNSAVVPALRDSFYHIINNRIVLSRENNTFRAELLKSSIKFPAKCDFNYFHAA